MKRLAAYTLIFLFGVTLFFSCKKDEPEEDPITVSCDQTTGKLDEVKQLIAGRYEWAYTTEISPMRGVNTYTPASTGTTNRYTFDRWGNAQYYENNKLIWDRKYEIDYRLRLSNYYLDSATVVILRDKETNQYESFFHVYLCNDSSLFSFPGSVDYFKYYKRERL